MIEKDNLEYSDYSLDIDEKPEIVYKTHLDIIKEEAAKRNIPLKDPKKGCKKCFGRGYIGFHSEGKYPVPCACIFPKDNSLTNSVHLNYKTRRKLKKLENKLKKAEQRG